MKPLAEASPFRYSGGGYYRRNGAAKNEKADVLHGMNAIRYLHAVMVGEDPTPFLNQITSAKEMSS